MSSGSRPAPHPHRASLAPVRSPPGREGLQGQGDQPRRVGSGLRAECVHVSVHVSSSARECTRVRREMKGHGLCGRETLFLRGHSSGFAECPPSGLRLWLENKPSVFKRNSSQSPFRRGVGRGFSSGQKHLRATRNWEEVMKLSVEAYYKFREFQASLVLVTAMYPNTG